MSLEQLVKKNLGCTFVTVSPEDEKILLETLRNKESINRVLGKKIECTSSAAYIYYIAMCHLKQRIKREDVVLQGGQMLWVAAEKGCGAAWWEMHLLHDDHMERVRFLLEGYALKDPRCALFVAEHAEDVMVDLMTLIPGHKKGGKYIKYFLEQLVSLNRPDLTRLMLGPQWSDVRIPPEDTETVREMLEDLIGNEDSVHHNLYEPILERFDLPFIEDIDDD